MKLVKSRFSSLVIVQVINGTDAKTTGRQFGDEGVHLAVKVLPCHHGGVCRIRTQPLAKAERSSSLMVVVCTITSLSSAIQRNPASDPLGLSATRDPNIAKSGN